MPIKPSRYTDHPISQHSYPIWIQLSGFWRNRGRSIRLFLMAFALTLSALACNLPLAAGENDQADQTDLSEIDALMEEVGLSIDEVMADPMLDERHETLQYMGAPDSFTLQWQELQGQMVRWEEWSYYDFESRFDFVDGVLLWTLDLEQAPNGSIFAHYYDPLAFEYGMTMIDVVSLIPDIDLTEIALDEADIPGGVLYAGDQILLGFDQDALVYVQTFILEPEELLDE